MRPCDRLALKVYSSKQNTTDLTIGPSLASLLLLMQVNAACCVVGMLNYATASLCLAHNTPYLYSKPGLSADEPFVCSMLQRGGLGLEMPMSIYQSGHWEYYLVQAVALSSHSR